MGVGAGAVEGSLSDAPIGNEMGEFDSESIIKLGQVSSWARCCMSLQ